MKDQINDIIGYLHGFWRYRWSALLISWIVGVIAAVFVLAQPNKYEANAVIHIDTASIMKTLLRGLAVETDDTQELNVITQILLSRENLLSIIRDTDMGLKVNTPKEKEALIGTLSRAIKLETMGRGIRQHREGGSQVYKISYHSLSPQQTYHVVSVLLNTMMERLLNSSRTDTVVAQKFLNKQIKEYEKRLSTAEKKMAAFKKENIGMMPDEQGSYYVRLQNAEDRVDSLRGELRLSRQRYFELTKQLSGEEPILTSGSYANTTRTQLQQYYEQLSELLTRYTDKHPDVLAVMSKIAELKKQENGQINEITGTDFGSSTEFNPVYQELKLDISRAKVEIESLKIQLSEQEAKVRELKGLIDAIPSVEAKLAELNRDYEITRDRYLEFINRRESARLAQVASQSNSEVSVRVIEPPVVPISPIGPNRPLLLLVALVGSLGVGFGWCVLRYMMAPTIINIQQLRQAMEYPIFGEVSYIVTPAVKRKRWMQLTSFLLFTLLLMVVYGGVIWKQEEGTTMVRSLMSNDNLKVLIEEELKQLGIGG